MNEMFPFQRFLESIKPTLKKHQLRSREDLNKVNLVSEGDIVEDTYVPVSTNSVNMQKLNALHLQNELID